MPHKPLCIVDTCSLIYLSEMELARKSLHRWLFDEFEVVYSQFVWQNEVQPQLNRMGSDGQRLRRRNTGAQKVWTMTNPMQYEQALFNPFSRFEQVGQCSRCGQATFEERAVEIDLTSGEDRGERHNCGVALDVVRCGDYRQVIYLTDDYNALRRYVQPIFEVFPLGCVWTSYDLVMYLFMRHRARGVTLESVRVILRDLTAKAASAENQAVMKPETQSLWQQRFLTYFRKAERIEQVMKRLP